jgi:hypothetical protein
MVLWQPVAAAYLTAVAAFAAAARSVDRNGDETVDATVSNVFISVSRGNARSEALRRKTL